MPETWVCTWVGKIPWRREGLPTPVCWPGEFHGVAKSWTQLRDFHSLTELGKWWWGGGELVTGVGISVALAQGKEYGEVSLDRSPESILMDLH